MRVWLLNQSEKLLEILGDTREALLVWQYNSIYGPAISGENYEVQ